MRRPWRGCVRSIPRSPTSITWSSASASCCRPTLPVREDPDDPRRPEARGPHPARPRRGRTGRAVDRVPDADRADADDVAADRAAPRHAAAAAGASAGLLDQVRERYRFVLLDTPAISTHHDSVVLSRSCDGVVVVMEAEATRGPVARATIETIERFGGKVLGLVFNKRRFYIPRWIYRRL